MSTCEARAYGLCARSQWLEECGWVPDIHDDAPCHTGDATRRMRWQRRCGGRSPPRFAFRRPLVTGSSVAITAALQLANGLEGWEGSCPALHGPLRRSWGSGDLAPERVVAMQRQFRRRPALFLPNLPTPWFEPELAHPTNEVVFCEAPVQAARHSPSGCLIYVFGTGTGDYFVETVARAKRYAGCEIYAFDPTVHEFASARGRPHVHFRSWGLRSASDTSGRNWTHPRYGRVTGELHSLGEIKRQLGHAGRRLTLVKADCEGCEWGWLAFQLREDAAALASIDQLHLELHLSKSLRFDDAALSNAPQLLQALTAHFRVVVAWPSAGFLTDQFRVPQPLVDAGVDPRPCCTQYLLLRRELAEPRRPPSSRAIRLHGALPPPPAPPATAARSNCTAALQA